MNYKEVLSTLALILVPIGLVALILFVASRIDKHLTNNKPKTFEINKPSYGKTKSVGSFPDEITNKKNIEELFIFFKLIWKALEEVINFEGSQKGYIIGNINKYEAYSVSETLRKIDISKINRKGTRIPIYVLKNAKIRTIADLLSYHGRYQSIYGIGEASERNINNNLNEILAEVKRNTKISLSYNNQNTVSTNLVHSVSILLSADPTIQKAKKLLNSKIQINRLLKELRKTASPFAMTFKQEVTLQKARDVVSRIMLIADGFTNFQKDIVDPFNLAKAKTQKEAWEDFKSGLVNEK